ncbi:hypothetical protein DL98DRAFT_520379, partial [Cadophora sp. DSE1049]
MYSLYASILLCLLAFTPSTLGFNLTTAAKSMLSDPSGRLDIGLDGVMRSLSSNGTIIDYYKLNAAELSETLELVTSRYPDKGEVLLTTFAGVDGTLVTDDGKLFDTDVPLVSALLEDDGDKLVFGRGICATGCLSSLMCTLIAGCGWRSICLAIFCL